MPRIPEPVHPGKIAVAEVERQGRDVTGPYVQHLEFDLRIRGARGGIALPYHTRAIGIDFEPFDLLHRRVVDAREGDAAFVGRPPVPGGASHLLLGHEFRHAVLDQSLAVARERAFFAGRDVDDEQILIAHEAHVATARREAGVGFVAVRLREPLHGVGPGAEIVDVQVAAQRHEQAPAVGRELVFDDAAQRGRALPFAARFFFRRQLLVAAAEGTRIHQQLLLAGAGVEGPQIESILVIGLALQEGDVASIGREFRHAQPRTAEIGAAEQPLDAERRGVCCGNCGSRHQ